MPARPTIAALAALLAVAVSAVQSPAHEVKAGSLKLTDLWTRATAPNAPTAAGYLTIANAGKEADRLVSVATPAAAKAELHVMEVKNGVMTMHPLEGGGIAIPAGGSVTLAPGGLHIMFITPKSGLKEGERMPVTLTFEKAGKLETFLHVLGIGAKGPEADAPHDMGGMKMDAPK